MKKIIIFIFCLLFFYKGSVFAQSYSANYDDVFDVNGNYKSDDGVLCMSLAPTTSRTYNYISDIQCPNQSFGGRGNINVTQESFTKVCKVYRKNLNQGGEHKLIHDPYNLDESDDARKQYSRINESLVSLLSLIHI